MYYPSLEEFRKKAQEANLIPVYREVIADMETPVSAFKKIEERYSYLLESIEGGEKWARYSFLGSNPSLIFKSKGRNVEIIRNNKTEVLESDAPIDILKGLLERYKTVEIEGLPRFSGGAVGYISYDMVKFFEDIPWKTKESLDFYDMIFIFTDSILIFDNVTHKIKIVSNAHLEDGSDIEEAYKKAIVTIDSIISMLREPKLLPLIDPTEKQDNISDLQFNSNMQKEEYEKFVEKAKDYIKAGDIFQVVLAQRFNIPLSISPFEVYRTLRVINPSPYMYYLKFDDLDIVGASPEVLVRSADDRVEVRPIAGTRPRGKDVKEDEKKAQELLADKKECAEHIMLVDLGRNDIGRVCEYGSVKVSEMMHIEKYSHVMHIVTNVSGKLKKGSASFDVFKACFPAGTVSGAPKVRAMEIIEELEPTSRGPYAGAIGYFSFSGNMDMCIAIRTIIFYKGVAYIEAGAGIVADSIPEQEYYETVNKAKAMMKAIYMACNG
ncbi:MAG: anthranilate synthase component I [bacterium]